MNMLAAWHARQTGYADINLEQELQQINVHSP